MDEVKASDPAVETATNSEPAINFGQQVEEPKVAIISMDWITAPALEVALVRVACLWADGKLGRCQGTKAR